MRHSRAPAEVTSIKLSMPKPTSAMLPANTPAITDSTPSRLFQAIVKYSNRLPLRTIRPRSVARSMSLFAALCDERSTSQSTLLHQHKENRYENQHVNRRCDHSTDNRCGNRLHNV